MDIRTRKINELYDKFVNLFKHDTMNNDKSDLIKLIVNNLENNIEFKIKFKHSGYTSFLWLKYKDNKFKVKNLGNIVLFEIQLTNEECSFITSRLKSIN